MWPGIASIWLVQLSRCGWGCCYVRGVILDSLYNRFGYEFVYFDFA